MSKAINILITSAGRRVGLIHCFKAAAKELAVDLTVFTCDLDPRMSAACQSADHSFSVCSCTDEAYIPELLAKVEEHHIHLVIPTIDTELTPLSLAVQKFQELGAEVHISAPAVIEIVRDKLLTSRVLLAAGVSVPRTAVQSEIIEQAAAWTWPVFAKPSAGSAGRGIQVIERVQDIPEHFDEPMIFQEYLQGPEYTINMFIDRHGVLQAVIPHLRIQTRAGEVEKGITVRNPEFRKIAEGVANALPGARGVLCFQLIVDEKLGAKVFEINARFGGGYPLADYAGGKFAKWLLAEVADLQSYPNDAWRDAVEMIRFDAAIYRG